MRGTILAQWKELGLASAPNTGDTRVHASASPFEVCSFSFLSLYLHTKLNEIYNRVSLSE